MTKFPEIRAMLPSDAKHVVKEYVFERLRSLGIDRYGHPLYRESDFHDEVRRYEGRSVFTGYTLNVINDCYDDALLKFERLHPVKWNNERQVTYRERLQSSM